MKKVKKILKIRKDRLEHTDPARALWERLKKQEEVLHKKAGINLHLK